MPKEGKIEKVVSATSKTGKPYRNVTIDGTRFGLWDEKFFPFCVEGNRVEFDFTEKGQFKNLTSLKVTGGSSTLAESGDGKDMYWSAKEQRDILKSEWIATHGCVNTAIEFYVAHGSKPDSLEAVFNVAKEVHKFIQTQVDKKAMELSGVSEPEE